jgi:hypothetical protein
MNLTFLFLLAFAVRAAWGTATVCEYVVAECYILGNTVNSECTSDMKELMEKTTAKYIPDYVRRDRNLRHDNPHQEKRELGMSCFTCNRYYGSKTCWLYYGCKRRRLEWTKEEIGQCKTLTSALKPALKKAGEELTALLIDGTLTQTNMTKACIAEAQADKVCYCGGRAWKGGR